MKKISVDDLSTPCKAPAQVVRAGAGVEVAVFASGDVMPGLSS